MPLRLVERLGCGGRLALLQQDLGVQHIGVARIRLERQRLVEVFLRFIELAGREALLRQLVLEFRTDTAPAILGLSLGVGGKHLSTSGAYEQRGSQTDT